LLVRSWGGAGLLMGLGHGWAKGGPEGTKPWQGRVERQSTLRKIAKM